MSPSEISQILIAGMAVNLLSAACASLLVAKYDLIGSFKGLLACHAVFCGLSLLVFFAALISAPAKAISKLTVLVGCQLVTCLLGLFGAGWALGVSGRVLGPDAWKLKKESLSTLYIMVGIASFCQLILVFFLIRGKESLVILRRERALPNVALSTNLCGDEDYQEDPLLASEGEYMIDPEFSTIHKKHNQKPTFNNKRRPPSAA